MMTPVEIAAANMLVELAFAEDLGPTWDDVTSRVTIARDMRGQVDLVSRETGILAGVPLLLLAFERFGSSVQIDIQVNDGTPLRPGSLIARLRGPMRDLLTVERTALNFMTHLSGVASLTRKFVDAAHGTKAVILDTRKTIPGYRRLQKYAVRMGGGENHRMGLFDGCLIKDNHLSAWQRTHSEATLADLIRHVRSEIGAAPLQVEVDRLDQLEQVLEADPDMVLLDNMKPDTLKQAVALRDQRQHPALLEASGGITLENITQVAATGVDRISIGALTHSAPNLDLGFDWSREEH